MSFSLIIETDNAAFEELNAPVEIARILRVVAGKFEADVYQPGGVLTDINGNTVGHYIYSAG